MKKIFSLKNDTFIDYIIEELNGILHGHIPSEPLGEGINAVREKYNILKNSESWGSIYDSLATSLPIVKILNKISPILSESNLCVGKIINAGVRIMEFNSARSYPIHQEWPDMPTEDFLVIWMPLHDLRLGDGCLMLDISDEIEKKDHCYSKNGYSILKNQLEYLERMTEQTMKKNQFIVLDPFSVHGSALMVNTAKSRWAVILRVEWSKNES